MNSDDLYKTRHKAEYRVANFPTRRQLKHLVLYWTIRVYACKCKFICYSLKIIYNTEPSIYIYTSIYMCIYIGFKTFFYVARHLDSIVSYLPTGLHLGFFRSWSSLFPPSSFSSTYSKYVWRYHDRPASSNGKAAALKSREEHLPSPDTSFFYEFIQNKRVGTLIVATICLQLIQNRYMFRSFTVLQCSHQHCVQPVAAMWKS